MNTQTDFAMALLDPDQPCPAGLKTWNGSDPSVRYAVYRNNVASSLIDALADTFPVVEQLVGTDFFRAMAHCYVRESPPASRLLVRYGEYFPDFVENFPPVASLPYLADVARLEWMRVRAYHAADAIPLAHGEIAMMLADSQQLERMTLTLHPSLQLLSSRYAVQSLWAAHQGVLEIETVDPLIAEDALVWRHGLDVEVAAIPAAGSGFVQGLLDGHCLHDAAAAALALDEQFDVGVPLGHLIRSELIVGIRVLSGQPISQQTARALS